MTTCSLMKKQFPQLFQSVARLASVTLPETCLGSSFWAEAHCPIPTREYLSYLWSQHRQLPADL